MEHKDREGGSGFQDLHMLLFALVCFPYLRQQCPSSLHVLSHENSQGVLLLPCSHLGLDHQ